MRALLVLSRELECCAAVRHCVKKEVLPLIYGVNRKFLSTISSARAFSGSRNGPVYWVTMSRRKSGGAGGSTPTNKGEVNSADTAFTVKGNT